MISVCEELKKDFDYILIDSPAGIEQGFKNALAPANRCIIVTTPEVSSVRDADRIIGLIEAADKGPSQLVINRVRQEMVDRGEMLDVDDVLDILGIELVGVIPDDEAIIISTNKGIPATLEDDSLASRALKNVAYRVTGKQIPFLDLHQPLNLFQRFSKLWNRG